MHGYNFYRNTAKSTSTAASDQRNDRFPTPKKDGAVTSSTEIHQDDNRWIIKEILHGSGPVWRRLLLNTWLGEIGAMGFSAACLALLAFIMRLFENQRSPNLPIGLTLNAIVSILATASKSSLIFTVAGTLSQLKWCWFTHSRKLHDLQCFDDASRGPLGSVAMLFSFSWRPMASIAALVTILALAFDPFIQQILKYPSRQISHLNPALATGNASIFVLDTATLELTNTINAGVWSQAGQFERNPPCPSGNCNWPLFDSVGWCSQCTDAIDLVELGEGCDMKRFWNGTTNQLKCDLSLGDGRKSNIVDCQRSSVANSTKRASSSVPELDGECDVATELCWPLFKQDLDDTQAMLNYTYLDIQDPALVLAYASLDYDYDVVNVERAEACVVTPCAREYNLSVTDGLVSADVVSINYGTILLAELPIWGHAIYVIDARVSDLCWQKDPAPINYTYIPRTKSRPFGNESRWANASRSAFCPVELYTEPIIKLMDSRAIVKRTASTRYDYGDVWAWIKENPNGDGPIYPIYSSDNLRQIQATNLSHVVGNVAASLTKLAVDLGNTTVTGNVTSSEVYVRVEWKWLILPIYLEIMAAGLLAWTIFLSHHHEVPLWKSSILTLLYNGLPERTITEPISTDVSGIEETARTTLVALAPATTKHARPRLMKTVKRSPVE